MPYMTAKERDAAEALKPLLPKVWRTGIAITGNTADTEELVRQTSMRVLERADTEQSGAPMDRRAMKSLIEVWRQRKTGDKESADIEAVRPLLSLPDPQRLATALVCGAEFALPDLVQVLGRNRDTVLGDLAGAFLALAGRAGQPSGGIPDGQLLAYLDKGLSSVERARISTALINDKALRARLSGIEQGGTILSDISEVLDDLAVPAERLNALFDQASEAFEPLSGVPDPDNPGAGSRRVRAPMPPPWRLASLLLLSFVAGLVVTKQFWPTPPEIIVEEVPAPVPAEQPSQLPTTWEIAIVAHVQLVIAETYAETYTEPRLLRNQLDQLEVALGLTVETRDLDLPQLRLVESQVLSFQSKPVGKVVFADGDRRPIIFSILRQNPDEPLPEPNRRKASIAAVEQLGEFNLTRWEGAGFAYIVISKIEPDQLLQISDRLVSRFP